MNDIWDKIESTVSLYVNAVRLEMEDRWRQWSIDLTTPELYEVIGGLVARQVTLATQLATSPGTWNPHVAPIFLRCMTDVYINLAWILKDPHERSRKFVLFGLGQQKLILEHRKAALTEAGKEPDEDHVVKFNGAWLNEQRFDFLTTVNVGSWSELGVRGMAEDAGCLDLYRQDYMLFSATTHSMWHHIGHLNLRFCNNPLHRYHRVPVDPDLSINPHYLHRAAKYVEKTLHLFDTTFEITSSVPSALDQLEREMERFATDEAPKQDKSEERDESSQGGE